MVPVPEEWIVVPELVLPEQEVHPPANEGIDFEAFKKDLKKDLEKLVEDAFQRLSDDIRQQLQAFFAQFSAEVTPASNRVDVPATK